MHVLPFSNSTVMTGKAALSKFVKIALLGRLALVVVVVDLAVAVEALVEALEDVGASVVAEASAVDLADVVEEDSEEATLEEQALMLERELLQLLLTHLPTMPPLVPREAKLSMFAM
jgi:hypothetical protein